MAFSKPLTIRLIAIPVVGLVSAACLLLALFTPRYDSSTTAVRPWAEGGYREILSPEAPAPVVARNHFTLTDFSRKDAPNLVTFEYAAAGWIHHYDPPQILTASPDGTVTFDDGSVIDLAVMAFTYPRDAGQLERVIFDPMTQEVHPLETWKARYPNSAAAFNFENAIPSAEWEEPVLHLMFDTANTPEVFAHRSWIFDAHTHMEMQGSARTSAAPGFFIHVETFRHLHGGPLTIASDFRPRLSHQIKISASEGESQEIEKWGHAFRILHLDAIPFPEGDESVHVHGEKAETRRWRIGVNRSKNEVHTIMFVSHLRGPGNIRVTYAAETKDGRVVPSIGGERSPITLIKFAVPPDQIENLIVNYSQPLVRVVFQVSSIPGIPKENEGVSNLFEVRIPYLRVRDELEHHNLVCEYSQLKSQLPRFGREYNEPYPKVFHDIEVSQLLDTYLESARYKGVRINRKTHELLAPRSWWDAALDKWNSL